MNRAEALFREALPRLDALREKAPLVHCMTGAVSVNFCANAVLALGARPICAEHPAESAEIAAQASALSLSLANITEARDSAMRLAAGAARAADIPMGFDAVGVGASALRRELAERYLAEKPWLIKGNASEIRALLLKSGRSGAGVDVGAEDRAERGEGDKILALARDAAALARREDTVVLLSGAVDLLTDGECCLALQNGVPLLGKICELPRASGGQRQKKRSALKCASRSDGMECFGRNGGNKRPGQSRGRTFGSTQPNHRCGTQPAFLRRGSPDLRLQFPCLPWQ